MHWQQAHLSSGIALALLFTELALGDSSRHERAFPDAEPSPRRFLSPATLEMTGESVSLPELHSLADLTLPRLIRTIRDRYKVKVVILNRRAPGPWPDTSILKENEEADSEAVRYYTRDTHAETSFARGQDALGEFQAPYLDSAMAGRKGNEHRPYWDRPLILLASNADRHTVLHELLHFLIYRSRLEAGRAERTQNFRKLALTSWNWMRMQQASNVAEEKYRAYVRARSLPARATAWRELTRAHVAYVETKLEALRQNVGEEADVSRVLYDSREPLRLEGEPADGELHYFDFNMQTFVSELKQMEDDEITKEILLSHSAEPELNRLRNRLSGALRRASEVVRSNGRWMKEQLSAE